MHDCSDLDSMREALCRINRVKAHRFSDLLSSQEDGKGCTLITTGQQA